MKKKGKVYIIGAGPGDPGLLTLKAAKCLAESDVVVYDFLVGRDILRHAKDDARLIYVGKKGGCHTVPQEELNSILVREASAGNIVARLKGGDPFIFGRGGEEAQILAREGIAFEIVPGITSAISVPAYAGIPLTHRDFTSTVAFVTGHEDPTKDESRIDWSSLAGIETLVFLMGVKNLPLIVKNLIDSGRAPGTPAALIRWGTTPDQRVVAGPLETIVKRAEEHKITPPAIFVVGDVVGLREDLNWFETRPLFGKGVVITRPEGQAAEFAELLSREGARVIYFPTIAIVPPEDYDELDRAIEHLEAYRWIIFTSANGVRFFFDRLRERGRDIRDLKGIRLCTIGPATATVLERRGIQVDLVPRDFISEGVVEAFKSEDMSGARVLLPRAKEARDVIPEGLRELGADVDVVTVYRTVRSEGDGGELKKMIDSEMVDVISFTSPSTVNCFVDIMGADYRFPDTVRVACIGPVTRDAVEKAGFPVHIMQGPYVIAGLVEAMVEYFRDRVTK